MTREEYVQLQPGQFIRHRATGRFRIVCSSPPHTTARGGLGPLALQKLKGSWTDPHPCAWYDAWVILRDFDALSTRGMSREYAARLRSTHGEPRGRFRRRR